MSLFNKTASYMQQASKILASTNPCTPVNDTKFTHPGKEINMIEYLYLFRHAIVPVKVFVVVHVYAHQYNWTTKNGVWVNEKNLAKHAKVSQEKFCQWRALTLAYGWLHEEKRRNKKVYIPAIGYID